MFLVVINLCFINALSNVLIIVACTIVCLSETSSVWLLSVCQSVGRSVGRFLCPSVCLAVSLSVCLSVCQSFIQSGGVSPVDYLLISLLYLPV